MKVWVTRPDAAEYYLGGWRNVRVWVDKPRFDHRPIKDRFELLDPKTGTYHGCVVEQGGWYAYSEPTKAKGFFKQDPEMQKKVADKLYESVVRADCADPLNKSMDYDEYRQLYENKDYDLICCTHWKRFLLEVDLYKQTVELINPVVIESKDSDGTDAPMTQQLHANYFIDNDMSRPFSFTDPQFEHFSFCDKRLL